MRLYIDQGHGDFDSGAVVDGVKEKDLNLTFSLELHDELRKEGHEVVLGRTTDRFIELADRANDANRELVDLFISIHCNDHHTNACGTEIWHYDGSLKGEEIAKKMCYNIQKFTCKENRGNKPTKKLVVLNKTKMSAVLIELGFMSNSTELKLLQDKGYRFLIIKGIIEALKNIDL